MRLRQAALPLLALALTARGAENVLLVVNADSWASTYIANEYAAARGIPQGNIVEVRDLPSHERMSVQDFRERILQPALKAAETRGLAGQIDYLLYSADLPTAIDVSADTAGKEFPKVITQPAAINGLTFFYQFTLAKNTAYLGLNANFYYRGRAQAVPDGPWPEAEQKQYAAALARLQAATAERAKTPAPVGADATLRPALETLRTLKAAHPKHTELLYNLACVHAVLGEGAEAVATLHEAVESGWWDMRHAQNDPDLQSIRDREDFKALATLAREVKFEHSPSGGFRGVAAWQPGGHLVMPDKGVRYLLSTMLGVTSGRGNSVKEALSSLHRSIAADGTRPAGTFYFMENGDVRSTTREWGFAPAAEKLRALGFSAVVEKGILPAGKADVLGATVGSSDFQWAKSGSTILPGAICEHLTSCGGMMREGDTQTPLTEFIRHGAAGSSGTVVEPYALQAKFPTPFVHWHYAQGCTLAESFYQSVAGPYQLLIVGDALCAPWKKRFVVGSKGLVPGVVLSKVSAFAPTAETDGGAVGSFSLHLDGRRIAAGKPGNAFVLDTSRFADGTHRLTIVGNRSDAVASQAEFSVPVKFRNHADQFTVTAPGGDWAWDKPIEIQAEAAGAKEFVLRHRGTDLAKFAGPKGSATLDARTLGQGPVTVQPVAIMEGGREVWAAPIALRITPPPALPSQEPGAPLAKGFTVTPAGGTAAVVEKAEGDWLAKAGVTPGTAFTLDAWFNVPEQDVYQFQIRGVADLRITIDGKPQPWPTGKEWSFIPTHLAAGSHQLRIEGKTIAGVPPEARFGGPGSYRLDGAKFQHRTR